MIGHQTATTAEELERLCDLLENETQFYRKLWRLAVHQNTLMREQKTEELEQNTHEWEQTLPEVERLRRDRELLQREMAHQHGWPREVETLEEWASRNGHPEAERLVSIREEWRKVASELQRQNTLNGELARFCLDLVSDEAEMFRRAVQEDQGGSYDGNGQRQGGAGGVVTHRA